jgi:hypothetical protein
MLTYCGTKNAGFAIAQARPQGWELGMMHGLDTTGTISDNEHKRLALNYVTDAWTDGLLGGLDGDCLAQACLFTAFAELVATYGEEAAAKYADGLSARIRHGEFSLNISRQ